MQLGTVVMCCDILSTFSYGLQTLKAIVFISICVNACMCLHTYVYVYLPKNIYTNSTITANYKC